MQLVIDSYNKHIYVPTMVKKCENLITTTTLVMKIS